MSVRRLFFCTVGLLLIGCVSRPFGAAAELPSSLSDASPPLSAASPGTGDRREAATVYCLSRPGQMTTALLALGLPVPGAAPAPAPTGAPPGTPAPTATPAPSGASPWPTAAARTPGPAELQAWAVHHRKDFDRACDALIGAQTVSREKEKKGSSGWVSAGKVIGPLLLGALLTLFTTEWRAAVDRGRREGLELRRLGRDFLTEASDYTERRRTAGQPSAQALRDTARKLALRLEEIKARRPWWRTLSPVLAALAPDRLDAAVVAGWSDLSDEDRKARHAAVMDVVHRIDAQVGSTARALEHPWRPPVLRWFTFWQKVPS
ncbi:hypothetical protein [Actinomadura mexicana]|uniref:Lipoprotein n=1 Tax=Actinomadura mexicana TaxID=134959 RepID=A0A238UQS6_9ACTN|nr:hypothetical protein [Actinomadura mexicana]SNR24366.1 hypothetical protein SAMN06265355_101295 [Actinomadura mexicana]